VIEAIFAVIGDVDVRPAVVVVVGYDCSVSPAVVGDSSLLCHVGEGTVVVVVKEGGLRRRLFAVERFVG
jgi:hypothetical protein